MKNRIGVLGIVALMGVAAWYGVMLSYESLEEAAEHSISSLRAVPTHEEKVIVASKAQQENVMSVYNNPFSHHDSSYSRSSVSDDRHINGIAVPPMPDKKLNDATLRGIESDKDGVRDDINIFLATEFGSDPQIYGILLKMQQLQEHALENGAKEHVDAYVQYAMCAGVTDKMFMHKGLLQKSSRVTNVYINTRERGKRYSRIFAGLRGTIDLTCRI